MHGRDTAGEVAVLHLGKSRRRDELGERGLRGKAANAFGKITIGRTVAGYELAKPWKNREGIKIIELIQTRRGDTGELHAEEAAAGFQHAIGFRERAIEMGEIPDAEGDRIRILAPIFDGKILAVAAEPSDVRRSRLGPALTLRQHRLVDVADGDLGGGALSTKPLSDAKGDVAGSPCHVDDRIAGLRVEPIHERV